MPGCLLALRVESQKLAGELAYRGASSALEVLPGLPAELRERRRPRVRPDVARDLRKLLVRDIEPILALESEVEVIACDACDLLGLEAEESPEAVVLVNDVVPRTKVRERLEGTPEPRVCAWRSFSEHLRVGKDCKTEVSPDESATCRADDESKRRVRRQRLGALVHLGVDLAEQALCAKRLATVRERDDDTPPLAKHPGELVLRLGETACSNRRPLRLEHVGLRPWERLELRGAVQTLRREPFFLPELSHLVRLPDDVGWALEQRHTVLDAIDVEVAFEPLGVEPVLARRIDHRLVDAMKRALCER